ncbi:MAG: choice-of-anchor L domain-containing protein, partial [Flavobacteriales bacterium]
MRNIYIKLAAIPTLLLLFSVRSEAQLAVDSTVTAIELANEIVGPGVTVSNVTLQSPSTGAGIFSNGNATSIGISNGILLTTGDAFDAIGPNLVGNTSKDKPDFADDPNIASITSYSIKDQCIFEFDFVAQSNQILVQYVFASEEYNEWVCTKYNDIFGFFVSGPNPSGGSYSGQNVALVPSSNLPVSINTINNGTAGSNGTASTCESLAYSNYYLYNANGTTIGYDGYTVILTSMVSIIPGQTYHFKFAIADISDGLWDSGIFIKADSFSIFDCEAGHIEFEATPNLMCADDNVADIIEMITTSIAPADTYNFILTNSSGQILEINSTGVFNLAPFGVGMFYVYGISYDGIVNNLVVGSNISAISVTGANGCFELTAPLNFSRVNCNPVLDCPDNVTFSCAGNIPAPNISSVAVISQLCPGGSLTWINDVPTGTACSGSMLRTYQFTDGCGHNAICQQTFSYNDNIDPVLVGLPNNATVLCGQLPTAASFNVTATDACDDDVTITSSFTDVGSGCNIARTITWTATDDCGNDVSASRTFTTSDTVDPVLNNLPNNGDVLCGGLPSTTEYNVTATDNCDQNVTITVDAVDVGAGCNVQRTITWTATDDCGNDVSASRTFTTQDNIAPTLIGVPANASQQC